MAPDRARAEPHPLPRWSALPGPAGGLRRSRSKRCVSQLIAKFRFARHLRRQKNGDFKVGFDLVEGDQKYRSRFQKEGSADALLQAARVTWTVRLLPLQPVLAECAHRLSRSFWYLRLYGCLPRDRSCRCDRTLPAEEKNHSPEAAAFSFRHR